MSKINSFEDLDVWKRSRVFAQEVYSKTLSGSFSKDFSLRDQLNRSCGSVMDNIAEGFEREGRAGGFMNYLKKSLKSKGLSTRLVSQKCRTTVMLK